MKNSIVRCFLWAVLLGLFACCFGEPVLLAAESPTPGKPVIAWHGYEEGLSLAKNGKKRIYLLFYTNRCHYCKVMQTDTFVNDQVITMLNDNFVSIKVDLDTRPDLKAIYPSPGVPMSWFLESNGDQIGSRAGYFPPAQFMEMLQFIVSEKYKK